MNLQVRYKSDKLLRDFDHEVVKLFRKFDFILKTTKFNKGVRVLKFERVGEWKQAGIDHE